MLCLFLEINEIFLFILWGLLGCGKIILVYIIVSNSKKYSIRFVILFVINVKINDV